MLLNFIYFLYSQFIVPPVTRIEIAHVNIIIYLEYFKTGVWENLEGDFFLLI
jgi:hypothetical protein